MSKKLRILMVDDHPMIIEGYKNVLSLEYSDDYDLQVDSAHTIDSAIKYIDELSVSEQYDLALIDIQLPASKDGKLTSGEDVALHLKKRRPNTRIIILTMHNTPERVQSILETIDPDAFLIKNDISATELIYACNQVLEEKTHYSNTVNMFMRKMVTNKVMLDDPNKKILHHLAQGVATKDLVNYVELSLSAIEKRKNQMKELFDLEGANDRNLVAEARKRGFIH